MIQERDDIVALDSAIIQHPRTWEASGHLAGFTDPLVDCRTCKLRFRADHLEELGVRRASRPSTRARRPTATSPRRATFNLMFETTIGPVKEEGSTVYLRPETAQGIFLDFKNDAAVRAQASRRSGSRRSASRSATRSRPATSSSARSSSSRWRWSSSCRPTRPQQWYEHWLQRAPGLVRAARHPTPTTCACAPHDADELSHYSCGTSDVEYLYPIGWSELEGIANRGDFDLTQHAEYSRREARVLRPADRASATSRT